MLAVEAGCWKYHILQSLTAFLATDRTVTIQEMEGGSPESLQAVGVTGIKGLQGILHSP